MRGVEDNVSSEVGGRVCRLERKCHDNHVAWANRVQGIEKIVAVLQEQISREIRLGEVDETQLTPFLTRHKYLEEKVGHVENEI